MKSHLLFSALLLCSALLSTQAQNTSPYWSLAGNNNSDASSKLGTTTAIPLNIVTNNASRIFVDATGRVGIGTTTPQQRFHIEGTSIQCMLQITYQLQTESLKKKLNR